MENKDQGKKGNYGIFFAMIGTSMVLMYFLTYLNSFRILEHAWFSETRLFMTLLMGSVMTVVMLVFMRKMYKNKGANIAIVLGAIVLGERLGPHALTGFALLALGLVVMNGSCRRGARPATGRPAPPDPSSGP